MTALHLVYMPNALVDEALRLGWCPCRGPLAHHDAYSTTMAWRCCERRQGRPPLPLGFRRQGTVGLFDLWSVSSVSDDPAANHPPLTSGLAPGFDP